MGTNQDLFSFPLIIFCSFQLLTAISMKVILRLKDLHAYGKICESVHKTAKRK